jgi:hypothetical protein
MVFGDSGGALGRLRDQLAAQERRHEKEVCEEQINQLEGAGFRSI